MEVTKTRVDGVLLIKPKVFGDERGYFVETYQKERYSEIGITHPFVQDNHSMSRRGILRGLHYQTKHPQGKLVMVSLGAVFDVAVDIRPDSPTFGKWFGAILSQENQHQLWIPPGLAHGFLVLSDIAHFHYKCTDFYDPKNETSILWNDPELNIEWPFAEDVVLSQKDMNALSFKSAVQLK
ncbi:dTDP-4-dehydrorhamnose 3,5-epimerase [uncultured Duodenibacillus sp.]|uniref:dTDP-4-dehydrorhamnose 3,5-epimerase n=1 Tax=uncultured Duodenibacillus sp. TaxID=1980699 RepID=UPI0025865CF8|nr:dTDP-4-dehydrorhamnose 3,5-epimerase [uncultured Duodenibacillus sp.]